MRLVERLWYGDGAAMRVARAVLAPVGAVYAAGMRARRRLYEAGVLPSSAPALPVISVGNLTVGGTGKTPVAAWVAARLRERAQPAILLRGYGRDEVEVHRRLNPGMPVVASANRIAGVLQAKAAGADVVVADDAFQHRAVRRTADLVLLSVEQLRRARRVLPAGPWREPLSAARQADLLVFTRKSATIDDARAAAREIGAIAPRPFAIVHLAADGLVNAHDERALAMDALRGRAVLAVSAIGEPAAFHRQLEQAGATVQPATFRDHHDFTSADVAALTARAAEGSLVVCTLKDAVKLGALWPVSSPLWYVSQRLVVDEGAQHLNRLLDRVLDARAGTTTTAG